MVDIMQFTAPLVYGIIGLLAATHAKQQGDRISLSTIKTLTLRKGLKTSHKRVPAISQLQCIGGTAKDFYEVDVMRCKNAGSSYSDDDVEWTCTASLPAEFKLGSTDVVCEGYTSPDDPYILKGSCGVKYRLMLTKLGEEKYGPPKRGLFDDFSGSNKGETVSTAIFWVAFLAILGWILYSAFSRADTRLGNGGGWGGGGGGGGDDNDPPPPYDFHPTTPKSKTSASSRSSRNARGQEGYRPGFWSGALGGAAAGYLAGRGGNRGPADSPRQRDSGSYGEPSNRSGPGRSSSSSSASNGSYGSARYESTGFGSSSRR